jgi:polyferredoxin
MNTLTNLLKDHQIGTWCKRAAWIVLAIGLAYIGFYAYTLFQQGNYSGRPLTPLTLGVVISISLTMLPHIIFYFFILYAAGALVNRFVTGSEEDDKEEDNDEVEEDEEIVPGQMR